MPEILVVDDDPRLRELVRFTLARAGFTVREAANGVEALAACAHALPDLVVLDVLMPELDGHSVCRSLRAGSAVPIIFLSTRGEGFDRVSGLDLGADDYLPKPFLPSELVSRVNAVLRRSLSPGTAAMRAGRVSLDIANVEAKVDDTPVELTLTEFRILAALLARPGHTVEREAMVRLAYGGAHHISPRTLDSHMRGVRHKLRCAGLGENEGIETRIGIGWRWA